MERIQIRFLGHAGFEVRSPSGIRVLMDPWLSGHGAFLRSWFPFPDNSFLAAQMEDVQPGRDALYLSHHHRDHFDPQFLRRLPRRLRVIVPRFVRPHLRRELEELGFSQIDEVDHGGFVRHGDLRLRLFLDESFSVEDSAILVECGARRFLNMNDCRANDRLTRDDVGAVDVISMQFSGASWYPSAYDYDPAERDRRSAAKNRAKFENVASFLRRIAPRLYLPAAGPPCFLDPALRPLNEGDPSPFPDAPEFLPMVARAGIASRCFFPGDAVSIDANGESSFRSEGRFDATLFARRTSYLEAYARERGGLCRLEPSPDDQLDRLEESLRDKTARLLRPLAVEHRVCVTLTDRPRARDGHVLVDLRERSCRRISEPPGPPVYHLRLSNPTMHEFFATGARWEDLLLSLRYTANRRPDVHVSAITDFLRLEPSDLERFDPRRPTERLVVVHAGRRFEIDRYCPHQNGDLRLATIDDRGILRCPRHGWEFDLEDGGRCALNQASLFARLLDEPREGADSTGPRRGGTGRTARKAGP